MDAKIDYLSWTIPLNLKGAGHELEVHAAIVDACKAMHLYGFIDVLSMGHPEHRGGRKLYGSSLFFQEQGVNIWWGGSANHVLIEVSGTGCQTLRDHAALTDTISATATRCTRLDIAVDFVDCCLPAKFVEYKNENRFRVTETQDTDTGWTQYVGSRKSERFARVYMYREPHPRAGVLRVEHVLRSDYAKQAASMLADEGLMLLTETLGNTFGWTHPRWQTQEMTSGKLRAKRHDKEDAATVRWLAKAVAPALLKAHHSGLIDLQEWLFTHVLSQIEDTGQDAP